MFEKIKNIFKYKEPVKSTPLKTVRDVDFFDTVWVLDKSGITYEGWIYDKTNKHIVVTVLKEDGQYYDYIFYISKFRNKTELEQNHNILFLNPCS